MNLKKFALIAGAATLGNIAAEKYVLKNSSDQPGLVMVTANGYMDDVARGVTIAGAVWLAQKLLKGGK